MKITVINWEKKVIEEYETDSIEYEENETDSIKYEENEISFSMWIEPGHVKRIEKIKYNQLLKINY